MLSLPVFEEAIELQRTDDVIAADPLLLAQL